MRKKKEKRNAVIITGYMRDYEKTLSEFKKNILTSDKCDVFIATWQYRGVKKMRSRDVKLTDGSTRRIAFKERKDETLIDVDHIKECYNPKAMTIMDLDFFDLAIHQLTMIVETSDLIDINAKVKPKSHATLMKNYTVFFTLNQGWKTMEKYASENNIEYEKVVRIRTDFEKGGYYPKIDWDQKINKSVIKIGSWNHQQYQTLDKRIKSSFQDHFAIGNYNDMKYYYNVFENLYKLSREFRYSPKQWHAEYCQSLWLTMNNIGWEKII